jgi:ribosomal protein L29
MAKELQSMTIAELEAYVNELDAQRAAVRAEQIRVQQFISHALGREKARKIAMGLSSDELAALAQEISGVGGIVSEAAVGKPGGK